MTGWGRGRVGVKAGWRVMDNDKMTGFLPTLILTGAAGIQKNKGHSPVITGATDAGDTARAAGLPGTSRAMTGRGEGRMVGYG